MSSNKIRYAVLGLGHIAQNAVLPAFKQATCNSELTTLISGDNEKLIELGKLYHVPHLYSYDEFDKALAADTFDAVYIALPNDMHKDYCIRAANCGVSVLCEKPMALTSEDCQEMIAVCESNKVKLMIAYRLHFERSNMEAVKLIKSGELGLPRIFSAVFSLQVADENYRTIAEKGGGPLYDIGIYCINAARYLFNAEPSEVMAMTAKSSDPRFREIEETVGAILKFPNAQMATFISSFGAFDASRWELVGEKGRITLDPAFDYELELKFNFTQTHHEELHVEPIVDQFAPELLYFSDCILNDLQPRPSGYEGLADIKIIEAIQKSAKTGKSVDIAFDHSVTSNPDETLVKEIPKAETPPMIKAPPSSKAS